jgi:RND family efflux transporter MFP subunit
MQGSAWTTDPVEGHRPPRSRRRPVGRQAAILLGLAAIGAAGFVLETKSGHGFVSAGGSGAPLTGATFYRAAKTRLPVTVLARGDLESSRNHDVTNEVEGQTAIIFLKPEGSEVKKGELVCELDSSLLRDKLTDQVIATQAAEADFLNASKTREVALIALEEFTFGTDPQNVQAAEDAVLVAQTNLSQATSRFEWSTHLVAKGYVTPAQNASDRDSKTHCEITLEQARTKLRVLKGYTRQKTLTSLQADIAKATTDSLAKQVAFELERTKQRKLETQIAKCKLLAPGDGMITFVNDDVMRPGSNQTRIEEGATVREHQKIFRLPDITHLRVNAKIHESLIDRISPGERARVHIDALSGQLLEGTVEKIQPLADPSQPPNFDVRVYTTLIAIDQPPPSLRPGMTAQAEILVSQTDDILVVPVQAVLTFQGKNHVYVLMPEGEMARREVLLGTNNDRLVEVVKGLQEGEQVIMDPMSVMEDQEKRELFVLGASVPRPDDWDRTPTGKSKGKGKGKGPRESAH